MEISKKMVMISSVLLLAGWGCQKNTTEVSLKDVVGQEAYFEQKTAKLEVKNQTKSNEMVLPTVVATQDSWAVIRADKGGVPGDVIGYAAVTAGEHKDVKVTIDENKITKVLHANLYVDMGNKGVFENQGADIPVTANDVGISGSFTIIDVK